MDHTILSPTQLSHHLRALRKTQGLSQADLGTRLGLSQSRVARMEGAPESISVDALLQLLAALNVRLVLSDAAAPRSTALIASEPTPPPMKAGRTTTPKPGSGDW